jgi:YidC/Oxa1 family membrane protein insertase
LEKRLPLFLFLSFLIIVGWELTFGRKFRKAPPAPSSAPTVQTGSAEGDATTVVADGEHVVIDGEVARQPAAVEAPAEAEPTERTLELEVGGAGTLATGARQGAFRAVFSNRGASLLELDFADYMRTVGLKDQQRLDRANWLPLLEPVERGGLTTGSLVLRTSASSKEYFPADLETALWKMEPLAAPEQGVRFRYSPPGGQVALEKVVRFEPGSWRIGVTLTLENLAAGTGKGLSFLLVPAAGVPAEIGESFYAEPNAVAIGRNRPDEPYELDSKAARGLDEPGQLEVPARVSVVGVHNKYFAFLLREKAFESGTLGGANYAPLFAGGQERIEVLAPMSLSLPAQGESRSVEYVVYAGPKAKDAFVADCEAHQLVLDDDLSVDSIARLLLWVLGLLHGVLGNWGLAIIALTLGVRILLFPLNRRSQTAMAKYQTKMKRVQPRLEEIKKRFEKDPQKLREAQARIMQEEGAFPPLGGCLPVFLQMPVFFGLFSALRTAFDLRQAPFYGYITDLSRPDEMFGLPKLPLLPDSFNLLPILMVVLWIVQQMGMPKPADEQAARMQKMMMFMPVVFGFMLYNYAAGLSLYMITTSGCSIIEQKLIKKIWPIDDTEVVKKDGKPSGCGPFSGMMQHLAEKQKEQMKRMQAAQEEKRRQEARRNKK